MSNEVIRGAILREPARAFALILLLLASSAGAMVQAQALIKVDGSSSVFPVTEAVAEEFQILKRGRVRVTVGISGTGGGFRKFCRGETDVQGASRPILAQEMQACRVAGIRYFELPICYDALTVAVSARNEWLRRITLDELKKLWEPAAQGTITRWSQINARWPDEPLTLFGAGSDSGTFDYFTEAIVGRAKYSRGDYTGSEDDNVLVRGIADDTRALGYLPFAYYYANTSRLRAVEIVDREGRAVLPSIENVRNGSYQPLSRPLFIYVSEKSAQRPEVKEFVNFYLANGAPLIDEVKYLPLPQAIYDIAARHFREGTVGTAFAGVPEVGLTVEALLAREKEL